MRACVRAYEGCVRACVRACVRVGGRACGRAGVRVFVRSFVRSFVRVYACDRVYERVGVGEFDDEYVIPNYPCTIFIWDIFPLIAIFVDAKCVDNSIGPIPAQNKHSLVWTNTYGVDIAPDRAVLDRTIGSDWAKVQPIGNVCYDPTAHTAIELYSWSRYHTRLENIDGKSHRRKSCD